MSALSSLCFDLIYLWSSFFSSSYPHHLPVTNAHPFLPLVVSDSGEDEEQPPVKRGLFLPAIVMSLLTGDFVIVGFFSLILWSL